MRVYIENFDNKTILSLAKNLQFMAFCRIHSYFVLSVFS